MKSYIIHLASAKERQPIVQRLQRAVGMESVVIDAVDKTGLSDAEAAKFLHAGLFAPRYPFPLSKGEIACFLSHRHVWQMIADGSDDYGLVFEDDVELDGACFAKQLAFALKHAPRSALVRFARTSRSDNGEALAEDEGIELREPALPGLQTCAALVGREAARTLIAETARFDRPIDSFLQMTWLHHVQILALSPPCFTEAGRGRGQSLIQSSQQRLFLSRLKREIDRWRYRRAIAGAAQRAAMEKA